MYSIKNIKKRINDKNVFRRDVTLLGNYRKELSLLWFSEQEIDMSEWYIKEAEKIAQEEETPSVEE